MSDLLPMFPLGTVLLPHVGLPLRVFEPRYRALVERCLRSEPEFGVVLISRGSEVGGGDDRLDVGCATRIVEIADDGRMLHLVTVGVRRLRVARWLPDDPYPMAEVDDWPDELGDDDVVSLVEATAVRVRRVLATAAEMGARVVPATFGLDDDAVAASYQLCRVSPVSEMDRYELLCEPSVASRLGRLGGMLGEIEAIYAAGLGDL